MKILILCTGNSCRSQMAHGFLNSFDKRLFVYSAGTRVAPRTSSRAVKVMMESGIDISQHFPKNVNQYLYDEWDYVITVCDNAKENCPVFSGRVHKRLHMGFEDPSEFKGTEAEIMNEFRRIRDDIRIRFFEFYKNKLIKDE